MFFVLFFVWFSVYFCYSLLGLHYSSSSSLLVTPHPSREGMQIRFKSVAPYFTRKKPTRVHCLLPTPSAPYLPLLAASQNIQIRRTTCQRTNISYSVSFLIFPHFFRCQQSCKATLAQALMQFTAQQRRSEKMNASVDAFAGSSSQNIICLLLKACIRK